MATDAIVRASAELRSGERLLWAGAPDPRSYGRQVGIPAAIAGALLLAFVIAYGASAASEENGPRVWLLALFGSPFLLVGLWMLAQPIWLERTARRMVYAITSERALIIERGQVRSAAFDQMDITERRERPDGSGTLYFAKERVAGRRGRSRLRKVGFIAVPQVREVEAILGRARRGEARDAQEPPHASERRTIIPAAG